MNSSLLLLIVKRLIKFIFKLDLNPQITTFLTKVSDMRKKNGLKYTIKYMKTVRQHILWYLFSNPQHSNDSRVSLDRSGFPTQFKFLKKILKENKQVVLTLLSLSRALVPTKEELKYRKVDTDTITAPYKGSRYTIPQWFIKDFVKVNGLHLDKHIYTEKDHYVSIKGSPNGKSSYSSLWSLGILNIEQLESIRVLSGAFFEKIRERYTYLKLFRSELFVSGKLESGKLSIIHDPELKERVIAMVDYTTQFILRPMHDQLLNLLKKFDCDRTFTQDPFNNWSKSKDKFYSLDLSAATDRFPISLQKKLISLIYNDYAYGEAWKELLVNRSFTYEGNLYKYSVGQPMGAYTSWAAFTLTHHLVVHWAAYLCGLKDFKDYIILGDDIVIKNNKVAQKYIVIMTRLGVEISKPKTFVSNDSYEFAKRVICKGLEVTGLSLKGILGNINNPYIIYMNIFTYFQRQPQWASHVPTVVGNLMEGLKIRNRIKSKNYYISLLYDLNHSIRYLMGLTNYEELRNYFHKKFESVDNYTAPSAWLCPSVIREVLSLGLVSTSKNLVSHINRQLEHAQNAGPKDLLGEWPLIIGYTNHIDKLTKIIGNISSVTNLIDLIPTLNLQCLDRILVFKRNTREFIEPLDKLWKNSFRLYLAQLKEESKPEKPPVTMASSMWGMAAAKSFTTTYKSQTIGVKTWNQLLNDDIKYLDKSLHRIREVEYNLNEYKDLRPEIWKIDRTKFFKFD